MRGDQLVRSTGPGPTANGGDFPHTLPWEADDLGWVAELDSMVSVLAERDGGFRLEAASRGLLEAMGLSRAAAIGRRLEEVLLTESALLLTGAAARALRLGEVARVTFWARSAGGMRARLAATIRPCAGADRRIVLEARKLRIGPAITEQRRTALFDELSLVNGGVLYVYDLGRGRKFDLSGLLGYPPGHPATVGEAILKLVHPDDLAGAVSHCHGRAAMPDGAFVTVAARIRHSDGDWRWIELRERTFGRKPSGEVRRVLGFASDVTERRRLIDSLAVASKSLLMAEAQERRRIARELHDSTAQHLVAIDLTLGRLERRLDEDPERLGIVADIREALTAAHREVRTFSYLLHPPDLERSGLDSTLRRFADGFAARTGLDVSLDLRGERPQLQPVGELALFRVAQEALMNVHHHARARHVEVALLYQDGVVTLEVGDDGMGLRRAEIETLLAEESGGVGIAGMRARMEQIGGALELQPRPRGLVVRATLPLPVAV